MSPRVAAARLVMSEADLQKAVLDLCGYRRIWHYHAYQPQRDNPGFPDLVLLGPGGALFRELKKSTGRVSKAQAEVGDRMLLAGLNWAVWRPEDLRSGLIKREIEMISRHRDSGSPRAAGPSCEAALEAGETRAAQPALSTGGAS